MARLLSPSGRQVAPAPEGSWFHDIDLEKMVSIQGHWFEIVAGGHSGLVLEYRYPVGRKGSRRGTSSTKTQSVLGKGDCKGGGGGVSREK